MPKLIKLYIVNVAIGFGLSVAFLGLLLWQDVAGLRHLILGSDMGYLAAFMMIMMNGVVFAGVQFAIAVMLLAEDPEGPPPTISTSVSKVFFIIYLLERVPERGTTLLSGCISIALKPTCSKCSIRFFAFKLFAFTVED